MNSLCDECKNYPCDKLEMNSMFGCKDWTADWERAAPLEPVRDDYYIDPCDPSHYKSRKQENWNDTFGGQFATNKPKTNEERIAELENEVAELKRMLSNNSPYTIDDAHWR